MLNPANWRQRILDEGGVAAGHSHEVADRDRVGVYLVGGVEGHPAEDAARQALREREREAARQRLLDELAKDPEAAWAEAGVLIGTKMPARYDEAVTLLTDLRELARRDGQAGEFGQRFAALRQEHLRKPSLIARFDRAGLTA